MTSSYTAVAPPWAEGDSLTRVQDAAARSGRKVRRLADGSLLLQCRVHGEDRNPSLHASWEATEFGGRTLLNCRGCGDGALTQQEWAEHLELDYDDLFDDRRWGLHNRDAAATSSSVRPRSAGERPTTRPAPLGKRPTKLADVADDILAGDDEVSTALITRLRQARPAESGCEHSYTDVTTYTYTDEQGRPVHKVTRQQCQGCGDKNFPQAYRAPDGRWVCGKPAGFSEFLYRHPQVVDAVRDGVVIDLVEGEKDALALEAHARVATTNPGGGPNFPAHLAGVFAGAGVRVYLDRDPAGWARGVKVHRLLTGAGARDVQLLLPATVEDKSDVADHLSAGHDVDAFIPVPLPAVAAWDALTPLRRTVKDSADAAAEADAQARLSVWEDQAGRPARSRDRVRFAARWAAETERLHTKAAAAAAVVAEHTKTADGDPWATRASALAHDLLDQARDHAAAAFAAAGQDAPTSVRACDAGQSDLGVQVRDLVGGRPQDVVLGTSRGAAGAGADDVDALPDNVRQHPASKKMPVPAHQIPMSRGAWGYDVGEGTTPRGVYTRIEGVWVKVAPLPYVHARIVRRNGDRRASMDYQLSMTAEGGAIIVNHESLKSGVWANTLGVPLSDDDKIVKATATAIREHAHTAAVREVDAVPRIDEEGRISIPLQDTLPAGYLQTAPGGRPAGLAAVARIIEESAATPKIALVMGAAAVAPFLKGLSGHVQSHVVSLYGDANHGKSVTMKLAASIWGLSHEKGHVHSSWNISAVGVIRFLGELAVFPAFLDETGMADVSGPQGWGKLLYRICDGAQRTAAESRSTGNRSSGRWDGILFSAGNGRLTDGLGAGPYAGVPKRVVDLSVPFTRDAAQADALADLIPQAYGHAGAEILDRYTTHDVQELILDAAQHLPLPLRGSGSTMAKSLRMHVAGAALLDDIAGTDTTLRDAALIAAQEHMQHWAEPPHDADRVLQLVRDDIASAPGRWPTLSDFLENRRSRDADVGEYRGGRLPQHGVDREAVGVRANDGAWAGIITSKWKGLFADEGIDKDVALRELYNRGLLEVPPGRRKDNNWSTQERLPCEKQNRLTIYKIDIREPDELPDHEPPTPPSGGGGSSPTGGPATPTTPTTADADAVTWPQTLDPHDQPATATAAPGPAVAVEPAQTVSLVDATPSSQQGTGGVTSSEPSQGGLSRVCHGSVTGAIVPLTCDVTGVTGITDPASCTYVPARLTGQPPADDRCEGPGHAGAEPTDHTEEDPMVATFVMGTYETAGGFSGEFVAYDEGQRPCACCGRPCNSTFAGIPMLHRCATGHPATTLLELRAALGLDSAPRPDSSEAVAPPNVAASVQARTGPAAPQPTPATTRRRPAPPGDPAGSKYTGQAACADVDGVWTGDGTRHPLPDPLTHLGQLADLADRLRLGVDTGPACPDGPATIAVTAALAAQLGVPTDLGDDELDWAQTFTAATEGHPVLTGALAAGWATSSSTDGAAQALRPWTRLWRAQGGSRTVFVAWLHALGGQENQPLAAPGLAPARVARRLDRVAATTTAGWRVSGSATGMDLLKSLHWKHKDRMLAPQPKLDVFVGEGAAFNWTRTPTTEERRRLFLHLFDRNGSWAAAGSGLELGYGAPEHRTDGVTFDKRIPGAWHALVPAGTDPQGRAIAADPDVRFPNPIGRSYTAGERVWLTTPTLEILAELGWELDIDQAWVWPDHGRLLDSWTAKMSAGRSQLDTDDPDDRAARDLVKTMYTKTLGMMGSDTYLTGKPGYAPHSLQSLQARSRANIVRRIRQIGTDAEARGQFCWPVVVVADMVGWVSDDPDPATAWPGNERWFGTSKFGQYKPEASALLDDVVDAFTGQPWSTRAIEQAKDRGVLVAADRWDPTAALAAARARRGE